MKRRKKETREKKRKQKKKKKKKKRRSATAPTPFHKQTPMVTQTFAPVRPIKFQFPVFFFSVRERFFSFLFFKFQPSFR
jgi:hypothetical protein